MVRSTSQRNWQREERDYFTLREMLHVLWGQRVLVLGAVLAFVLASLAYSMFQETSYKAEAVAVVVPQVDSSSGQDAEAFVDGVRGAVDTQEFRAEVMQQAGWQEGESEFDQRLEIQTFVQQDSEESGLKIRFFAPDAEEAARVANTYATLFVEHVGQLNDRLAGGSLSATVEVQSRAMTPEQPASPRPLLYALVATVVGLLAGGAVALALESRTQSWRGARDAELTLRAPVLGVIPDYSPEEGDV